MLFFLSKTSYKHAFKHAVFSQFIYNPHLKMNFILMLQCADKSLRIELTQIIKSSNKIAKI